MSEDKEREHCAKVASEMAHGRMLRVGSDVDRIAFERAAARDEAEKAAVTLSSKLGALQAKHDAVVAAARAVVGCIEYHDAIGWDNQARRDVTELADALRALVAAESQASREAGTSLLGTVPHLSPAEWKDKS